MKFSENTTIVISFLAIAILIAGLFVLPKQNSGLTIDLIGAYDWSHFAGASKNRDTVSISPVNRYIQALDEDKSQLNAPINLAGPEIKYSDNFIINADTDGLVNGAAIRLYGGVPIIYDEWRFEPESVEIKREGDFLKVSLWDGNRSAPARVNKYPINFIPKTLKLEKTGDLLKLTANDEAIFESNAKPLFKAGRVWLGLSALGEQGWQLNELTVNSDVGAVNVVNALDSSKDEPESGWKIKFGAAVALNPLLTDKEYRDFALNIFNIWTPENELKAQFIHPNQNTYSFNEADLLVDTAINNRVGVHGHALVFGEANPSWMYDAPDSEKQAIMTDHIAKTMSHFQGRIDTWDVINEPLSDEDRDYSAGKNGLRQHFWYKAMGPSYIATALKTARSADNKAKLYINDYGLEADGPRWQTLLNLVDELQAQSVPLDGIGFQAHIHEPADRVDPAVLSRHMRELAQRGLDVRISEIDVFGDEGTEKQATDYSSVLSVCLSQPNCVAYSTWGITDKYGSTAEYRSYPPEFGNDLLWDSSYKPKPAYFQISKLLNGSH